MHRLFAAIPVPAELHPALIRLQKGLTGASWRPPANFHITLRFFGDLPRALAEALDEELAQITASPFSVALEGAGWFGRREPYSAHVRVAASDPLNELSRRCERAARRLGLPAEKRAFKPHVTLAYLHGTPLSDVMTWSEGRQTASAGSFYADTWHLYESFSGKGASRYVPQADYVLG